MSEFPILVPQHGQDAIVEYTSNKFIWDEYNRLGGRFCLLGESLRAEFGRPDPCSNFDHGKLLRALMSVYLLVVVGTFFALLRLSSREPKTRRGVKGFRSLAFSSRGVLILLTAVFWPVGIWLVNAGCCILPKKKKPSPAVGSSGRDVESAAAVELGEPVSRVASPRPTLSRSNSRGSLLTLETLPSYHMTPPQQPPPPAYSNISERGSRATNSRVLDSRRGYMDSPPGAGASGAQSAPS